MGVRYGIVIGINDYVNHKQLDYCRKDALDIALVMELYCHVDKANIRSILSSNEQPNVAPWQSFLHAIENLSSRFNANEDDLILYFSGHGIENNQTTAVFGNSQHGINEIIDAINILSPKTRVMIFDCCHSGAGIQENERSASFISTSNKTSAGHVLLTSCSKNETAKESPLMQNGKFTGFLKQIISDKVNYDSNACLDINSLFSKVNAFFVENPDFKQLPNQQIKTVGSYPLASAMDDENFYARFDVTEPLGFDWSKLLNSFRVYLFTDKDLAGELFRYIREYCLNALTPTKGNATHVTIEITKNKIILIDNGEFFDLFNPPNDIVAGGGIKTASYLSRDLSQMFKYNAQSDSGSNIYTFDLVPQNIPNNCQVYLEWEGLYTYQYNDILIDSSCNHYIIRFSKYALMLSTVFTIFEKAVTAGEKFQKPIFLEFKKGDRILDDAIHILNTRFPNQNWVRINTYE